MEAAAGTNPFDANPPGGYIQPVLEHYPAVYMTGENGPEIVTPEIYTLIWPTLIGKQYTLLFSASLAPGSWLPIGPPVTASGPEALAGISIAQPDGSIPAAIFWRVAVSDTGDADGDGLNEYEENQLGTDPYDPATNGTPDGTVAAYTGHPGGEDPPDEGTEGTSGGTPATPLEPLYMNFSRKHYSESCITIPPDESDPTAGATYDGSISKESSTINGIVVNDHDHSDINLNTTSNSIITGRNEINYPVFEAINSDRLAYAMDCADHGYGPEAYFDYARTEVETLIFDNGIAESSRFRLERLQPENTMRTLTYLKLHQKYYWNKLNSIDYVKLKIPATALHSDEVDLKTNSNDSKIRLARFSISDNEFATGVDNLSCSAADVLDTGYQEFPWIMAPCGGSVAVGGTTFRMNNRANINIGNSISGPMEITCPNAKITPSIPHVVTGEDLINTVWTATGNTTSDETPVFKFGEGPGRLDIESDQITAELPVRVKVMKKRTVTVAVWPIKRHSVDSFLWDVGDRNRIGAQIQTWLNRVFASQINAWFDVHVNVEQEFEHVDNIGGISYTITHGAKEKEMIATYRETNVDINLYLIKDSNYFSDLPSLPESHEINGSSYPTRDPSSGPYANCSVVTWRSPLLIQTIAHEVGHLIVGPGHPDHYTESHPEYGGPAPLQQLTNEDHLKRLMFSSSERRFNSLLVKAEWDKAEEWLSIRPNGDN